jgi:hypothetical protein
MNDLEVTYMMHGKEEKLRKTCVREFEGKKKLDKHRQMAY